MDKTAIGAATRGTEQEICKVRVRIVYGIIFQDNAESVNNSV